MSLFKKKTPEQQFVDLTEPPKTDWHFGEIIIAIGIILIFLVIIFVMQNDSKDDSYGVKDWSVQCGEFKNQELYFRFAVFQDNDQLLCTFDNGVKDFVEDENGVFVTNPGYKVCYRLFHASEDGGWVFDGQTC